MRFDHLSRALAEERAPLIALDLDALDRNIETIAGMLQPGMGLRLVAKSLPSVPLINYIADRIPLTGMMVFAESMADILLGERSDDLLLGKPLPVEAARDLLARHPNAAKRVQWLIDSAERAEAYLSLGQPLRLSLEVDVGLHRGGFRTPDAAAAVAHRITDAGSMLAGMMGYEPHLAQTPRLLKPRELRGFKTAFQRFAELMPAGAVLNSGGSLTFAQHHAELATEVSAGSAFVLPSDFDGAQNRALTPAAFIATPVLKRMDSNPQPVLSFLRRNQIAIQGGYWKAKPVHPAGARYSSTFGRSTNQEVWDMPKTHDTTVGDWAYLRPHQSEAVISYLGRIAAIRGDRIEAMWDVLPPV